MRDGPAEADRGVDHRRHGLPQTRNAFGRREASVCGQLGKEANCQVAVSLSIANHSASLPVAYRLYLPKEWSEDAARRKKAGVPRDLGFKTKPEIALEQIRWACEAGLPRGVGLMDTSYGTDLRLRTGMTARCRLNRARCLRRQFYPSGAVAAAGFGYLVTFGRLIVKPAVHRLVRLQLDPGEPCLEYSDRDLCGDCGQEVSHLSRSHLHRGLRMPAHADAYNNKGTALLAVCLRRCWWRQWYC